jgi:hypothetical protein
MFSVYFAETDYKGPSCSIADLEVGRKLTEEEAACLLARRGSLVLCCCKADKPIAFVHHRSLEDLSLEEARRVVSCAKRIGEGWRGVTSTIRDLEDL